MSGLECLRVEWLDQLAASPEPRVDPSPNYGNKFEYFAHISLALKIYAATHLLHLPEDSYQIVASQFRNVLLGPTI